MNMKTRWVKRSVAKGEVIHYDRFTGKIVRKANIDDIASTDQVWTGHGFNPHAPLKAYFDLSYKCNFNCLHCITSSHPHHDTSKELSTGRILDMVDELANIGTLEVAIGGGEPLLHKHYLQIFKSITRTGMNLTITTNGSLAGENIADELSDVSPLDVRVSFDGGPELHDSIRGNGAYKKAMRGLLNLITAHVPATARLTLSSGGDDELHRLFDDLADIGVKKTKVALTKPIGRATDQGRHLVRAIESAKTSQWLMKLGMERGMLIELSSEDFAAPILPIMDSKLRVQAPHCGAGFETAYISATGRVTACVAMPTQTFGELHGSSFEEVWMSKMAMEYRDWASGLDMQRICDACHKKCKQGDEG